MVNKVQLVKSELLRAAPTAIESSLLKQVLGTPKSTDDTELLRYVAMRARRRAAMATTVADFTRQINSSDALCEPCEEASAPVLQVVQEMYAQLRVAAKDDAAAAQLSALQAVWTHRAATDAASWEESAWNNSR